MGLELKAETQILSEALPARILKVRFKSEYIYKPSLLTSQLLTWLILSWTFSCHHPDQPPPLTVASVVFYMGPGPGAASYCLLHSALVASEGWLDKMPASDWSLVSQCSPLIGWWRLVSGPSEHGVRSQRALETLWHKNISAGEDHSTAMLAVE